jgi:hypothetical protein
MDKRKFLQLQLLTNKLNDYKLRLKNLTSARDNLITISSDHYKYLNKTKELLEECNSVEFENKLISKQIHEERTNKNNSINEYKSLPLKLNNNIELERTIHLEECLNIEELRKELEANYNLSIKQEKENRIILEAEIKKLQDKINNSNEKISIIQENAHTFRKNILLELHKKKEIKKQNTEIINNLEQSLELHNNKLLQIQCDIDYITSLKKQFIDNYYLSISQDNSIPGHSDILEELKKYITIPEDVGSINLNKIILLLDIKIKELGIILGTLSLKNSKNQDKINNTINHIRNNIDLPSRKKVISYKDNFKLAKKEKTDTDTELKDLQYKFDNWELLVITEIKTEYQNKLEQLEQNKNNSIDRLNIMVVRFNDDFESKKKCLENKIQIHEEILLDLNNKLVLNNKKIKQLKDNYDKLDSNNKQLEKINNDISEIMTNISKTERDIEILQN